MDLREEGDRVFFFLNMEAHTGVLSCTDILSVKSHLPPQSHLTRSGGLAAEMKALAGTKDKVHDGNILHLVLRWSAFHLECVPCSLPSQIWKSNMLTIG